MNNAKYAVYRQVSESKDMQKESANLLDFMVRFHQSIVDNDRPIPAMDVLFYEVCDLKIVDTELEQ